MKTSDSFNKFAEAFVKAQAEISGASKDKNNPAFKSKYADLESVTDAIRPAAAKHGLAYLQDGTLTDDNKLLLVTRVIHLSGEWVEYEMRMPISKLDPQGFGSALTYARRYALSAAFGVAPEDDDGNAATGVAPKPAYSSNTQTKPAYTSNTQAKPATPAATPAKPTPTQPPANLGDLVAEGEAASKAGIAAYKKFWGARTPEDKSAIGEAQHKKWVDAAVLVKVTA